MSETETGAVAESRSSRVWNIVKTPLLAFAMVGSGMGLIIFGTMDGVEKERELTVAIQGYNVDGATLTKGRGNASWFNGITVDIAKNGTIHTCKHVHFDDLRAGKPISCNYGVTITKD